MLINSVCIYLIANFDSVKLTHHHHVHIQHFPLSHISGKMLALWEIHPPLLFSSDMGTFCWIGLNVFNMFSQLSTSVTPFSRDHYCKCNSGPNNTLQYHAISHSTRQYQEYNNTLFNFTEAVKITSKSTSWCFDARAGALYFYGHVMFSLNILPELWRSTRNKQ